MKLMILLMGMFFTAPLFAQAHGERSARRTSAGTGPWPRRTRPPQSAWNRASPKRTAWKSCATIAKASESANTVGYATSTDMKTKAFLLALALAFPAAAQHQL